MKKGIRIIRAVGCSILLGFLMVAPPAAADEELGWSDTAEFGFVATDGNTETSTLGFKNKLRRAWESSSFELKAGGIRVETTTTTSFAVGTTTSFIVTEESDTEVTAENYYLNGRFDHKLTDRFFWYTEAGWDRNEFAGIENRYTGVGGLGNIWKNEERIKFRTDYGLTYTKQDDVIENPEVDDTFLGFRFSWEYKHKFGENTTYSNDLSLDENLDETSDFRGDMINSVAVSMNEHLALKVSLQWLYDNEPSFELINLYDIDPGLPGAVLLGEVPEELDDLDTILTASLVINF